MPNNSLSGGDWYKGSNIDIVPRVEYFPIDCGYGHKSLRDFVKFVFTGICIEIFVVIYFASMYFMYFKSPVVFVVMFIIFWKGLDELNDRTRV